MPYKCKIKIAGIYSVVSPSGRIYIGKTRNFEIRNRAYRVNSTKKQEQLRRSISKYGWETHKMEIVHELPKDVTENILNCYERLYIEQYNSNLSKHPEYRGLNLTDGGEGSCGRVSSTESRKKMSESAKKREQHQLKYVKRGSEHINYGKRGDETLSWGFRHTEEAKKRIGAAQANGKHSMAIKVIDIKTGAIFDCIKEAALSVGYRPGTLSAQLTGRRPHKTNMRYLNK